MEPSIPDALADEHAELHAALTAATHLGGRTGEAARTVAALLAPHLHKEETVVFPQLGALEALAAGGTGPELRALLPLGERLEDLMGELLAEHRAILTALELLVFRALDEDRRPALELARRLQHHAALEEQVLYPAARLVVAHLRARLGLPEVSTTVEGP